MTISYASKLNSESGQLDEKGVPKCSSLPENDVGNAHRLLSLFGDDLIYIDGSGWRVFDGVRWARKFAAVQLFAQKICASIIEEAFELSDPDARKRRMRWAAESGNTHRINGMLTQAKPNLLLAVNSMDADPMLINLSNGTFDLRKFELRPHERGDLIGKLVPLDYDPDAKAPLWLNFLDRVVPDPAVREFLCRWCGYMLTGRTDEQSLVFLYGRGANGKSTFVETLRRIFADYGASVPFQTLLHEDRRRGGEPSPELARLPGVRMVVAAEPDIGGRFSESLIKSITGGDTIIARHLRKDFFEFRPSFKLILAGNHRPAIRGNDDGIWRRVLLVPFEESIPPCDRDKQLSEKLWREAPGILAWIIEGCRMWSESGLAIPGVVAKATEAYRIENDPIGEFLADATVDTGTTQATELYGAYEKWCRENGRDPITQRLFGTLLGERGFKRKKQGVYYWHGISIVVDTSNDKTLKESN